MARPRVRGVRQLQLCLPGEAAIGAVGQDDEEAGFGGEEKKIA